MAKRIILGVHLTHRAKEAPLFQELLTKYGCSIKTRIGLHNVADGYCSTAGLIILEMYGDEQPILDLEQELNAIEGIDVRKMTFEE